MNTDMTDDKQFIYHLITADDLAEAKQHNAYAPESLHDDNEGFIHASFASQVAMTVARFYANRDDVHIMEIDTNHLNVPVKVEDTMGHGEAFPHIYGAIPWDAITRVETVAAFIGP